MDHDGGNDSMERRTSLPAIDNSHIDPSSDGMGRFLPGEKKGGEAFHLTQVEIDEESEESEAKITDLKIVYSDKGPQPLPEGVKLAKILPTIPENIQIPFSTPQAQDRFGKLLSCKVSRDIIHDAYWLVIQSEFHPNLTEQDSNSSQRRRSSLSPQIEENTIATKLLGRLSQNYLSLFIKEKVSARDKTFARYCDALSQVLWLSLHESFPKDTTIDSDDFKLKIIDTVSTWILGMKPSAPSWKHWDLSVLSNNAKSKSRSAKSPPRGGAPTSDKVGKLLDNIEAAEKKGATSTKAMLNTTSGRQYSMLAFSHTPLVRNKYVLSNSGLISHHFYGSKPVQLKRSNYSLGITMTEKVAPRLGYTDYRLRQSQPPEFETKDDTYSDVIIRCRKTQASLREHYKSEKAVALKEVESLRREAIKDERSINTKLKDILANEVNQHQFSNFLVSKASVEAAEAGPSAK